MKKASLVIIPLVHSLLSGNAAERFSAGSNGSYGPIEVNEAVVLDLPPDGIFHCTTIQIGTNGVLKFRRNAANTPVYLLASGNISVEGEINLNGGDVEIFKAGKGGPGGFDGGEPTTTENAYPAAGGALLAGSGYGPGGGYPLGSAGSYATGARPYGNSLLVPLIGGSGSGAVAAAQPLGGAGGGGAILLASDTILNVTGRILANGGNGKWNGGTGTPNSDGGSGGAIRLIAPIVSGDGSLSTWGGGCQGCSLAGQGRIRIDTIDDFDLKLSYAGVVRQGREMYVFPQTLPRLEIIEATGLLVPPGTVGTWNVQLGPNASTNQTVKIRAHNFVGRVPLEVVVVPEIGPPFQTRTDFEGKGSTPVDLQINIQILPDRMSRVQAWTR